MTSVAIMHSNEQETTIGYQSIESGNNGVKQTIDDAVPQTFLSQVKEAKENSQGCCNFCMTFFGILIGSIVWFLILVITFTLPIVMIILGAIYFNDCPDQRMIPIFNLVAGFVVLIICITNMIDRVRRLSTQTHAKPPGVFWFITILNIFLAGWFIAGCYWVYSIYPGHETKNFHCDMTLYSFTYWLFNACFIFLFSMVLTSFLMMCLAICCF